MATADDVMDAMVAFIKSTIATAALTQLLPNSDVFKGWPHPEEWARDLREHTVNISVYDSKSNEKLILDGPIGNSAVVTGPDPHLTAVVWTRQLQGGVGGTPASATITLGGSVNTGTITMTTINKQYVPFRPTPAATLTQTAIDLAAAINANVLVNGLVNAIASVNVVTVRANVPGTGGNVIPIEFAIGGTGLILTEVQRQESIFDVHIWAWDDETRILFAALLRAAFSSMNFITFSDTTTGRIKYERQLTTDSEIKFGTFRRTLYYRIQYAEVRADTATQILANVVTYGPLP